MRRFLLLLIALSLCGELRAQYYTSGSSDFRTKWSQIKGDSVQILYPDYYYPKATLVDRYIDTMRNAIMYGYSVNPAKVPVILYPEKAQSNGLVVWTPKRLEMYTTPSNGNYSLPWLKQLAVHEYRHVVQISNLDRGVIKVGKYILGEQMIGAATALISNWFYEGDATLAETQLAIWGRGKQPQFSAPVRALINEMPKRWSYDKWKVGSMKHGYPSIYELGYFSVWAGQTFYSPTIWEEMFDYASHRPIRSIFDIYNIKRKYGVNREGVIKRTIGELSEFWAESFVKENTAEVIPKNYRYYEEFSTPTILDDSTILAVRVNKSSVKSIVTTDINSGESRVLDNSVYMNSRPVVVGDMLYWSEYKPSLFWENNSISVIKSAEITKDGSRYKLQKLTQYRGEHNNPHYITNIDNNRFAYIDFDSLNNPHIIIADRGMKTIRSGSIGDWDSSIAGMDYDDLTDKLYLSLTDNRGVVLTSIDPETLEVVDVFAPSHVTVANLRADSGKLYFSSTLSGKDEIHMYDLTDGFEYQVSKSKYGSYDPSLPSILDGDSTLLVTTYEFGGYRLATQKMDSLKRVVSTSLPSDRLIPSWYDWNMPKIDTITFAPDTARIYQSNSKRYRRLSNSFNPHSWMPLAINPINQMNEVNLNEIGFGATVVSQNLLGGLTTSIGYGYMPINKMGMLLAGLSYTSFPVHLDVDFNYGGYNQSVYSVDGGNYRVDGGKYMALTATASMPTNFSDGRRSRVLTPFIGYSYDNTILVYNPSIAIEGLNKISYGVGYSNAKYMSEQSLESPLSYYLLFSSSINPVSSSFGKLFSLYGKTTLPGIATNHSIVAKANIQYQKMGSLNYTQKVMYPRGNNYNFAAEKLLATALEYKFPLCFPDAGIGNELIFKRVALGVFGEYADVRVSSGSDMRLNPYTYGAELILDYHLIGLTPQLSTTISVYKPSEQRGVALGASFNIAL